MGDVVHLPVLQPSREQLRSRRKRDVRKRTIMAARMTKGGTAFARTYADSVMRVVGASRPRTRGECERGERPCPWVSCRHNLYLDVNANGSIVLNFPDIEDDEARDMRELRDTCALDVADRGGETLEGVGERMNFTRERTRQVEAMAVAKVSDTGELERFRGVEPADLRAATVDHAWAEDGGGARATTELRYSAEGVARGVWDLRAPETDERLAFAQSRAFAAYESRLADRGLIKVKRHALADEILAGAEEVIAARAAERETEAMKMPTEEELQERRDAIIAHLNQGPSNPAAVGRALGITANQAGTMMRQLVADEVLTHNGKGGRGTLFAIAGTDFGDAKAPRADKPRAPKPIAKKPANIADVTKKHAAPPTASITIAYGRATITADSVDVAAELLRALGAGA